MIKLPLTESEKANLKRYKLKISQLIYCAKDELASYLDTNSERVDELRALAEFQTVPSIGIKFAGDLVFLGYYSLDDLKEKDGALLLDSYERQKGYWVDACVEDQFRLVVHYARTQDITKSWWHFTGERKKFRLSHGYPVDRPTVAWHETSAYKEIEQSQMI